VDVPTSLTLRGPILIRVPTGPTPWPFSGKLAPTHFPFKPIRIVYTHQATGYSFTRTVAYDDSGDYQDSPPPSSFESHHGPWQAQSVFDGEHGYAPTTSPIKVFMVEG
jgi:hypothetical protein